MALGRRWFVEIFEIEGRCCAMVGYSQIPGGVVVWDQTTWTLPAEPRPMQHMVGELMDACLVLQERQA